MTSRKKPQQQLACYFDELLTELEEPSPDSEKGSTESSAETSIQQPTKHSVEHPIEQQVEQQVEPSEKNVASNSIDVDKGAGTSSSKNSDDNKPVTPAASTPTASTSTASTSTSSVQKSSSSVVNRSRVNTEKVGTTNEVSKEVVKDATKQVIQDRTQSQTTPQVSPQVSPQEKRKRTTDSDLDLRQREKERLERLLNSLPPTIDLSSIEAAPKKESPPADTIVVKVKTQSMPAVELDSPDKLSSQQITAAPANVDAAQLMPSPSVPLEPQIVGTEEAVEVATEVESIIDTNATHQWQPLGHEWLPNGRPAWAEEPFDVLLVDVQGIQLAMPLASLDGIYPLKEELTPLFGQSEWFMGLQKTISGNVNVINTAQFIMPERYVKSDEMTAQYSVAINGSGWALAVDAIHQPMMVNPDDIRWRKRRSERPWMAGTIKDHVCALIDIPSLANMFKQQDKNG
jgi:purine-binding chemotaxis protein CheW